MTRTARLLLVPLAFTSVLVGAGPAMASPAPTSSCAAQLNQGATPHGLSQSPPGFLGAFTAQEATSAPGTVGAGSSAAAAQHGDLFSCLPS